MSSLRQWREETHGSAWELVRHFVLRFFDNEMITIPGEWQKVAAGVFAALVSVALAAATIYRDRYLGMHEAHVPFAPFQQAIRDDLISFLVLAMAVTALLTILQWQSLFPSLRDCLALAGLPVNAREIFIAKFGAVILIFAAFVISMTAFHGRGFFPDQFKPGDPQALVAALEAFVGLVIEVSFIATFNVSFG